jgi:hypothetical protein
MLGISVAYVLQPNWPFSMGHMAWNKTLYIQKYSTPISKTFSRISNLFYYMLPTIFLNNKIIITLIFTLVCSGFNMFCISEPFKDSMFLPYRACGNLKLGNYIFSLL